MVGLRRDGEEMEEGRMGSESGPSEVPSNFSAAAAPMIVRQKVTTVRYQAGNDE